MSFTRQRYLIPTLLALSLASITTALYLYVIKDIPERFADEVKTTGKLASQDFEAFVEHKINTIENLRDRVEDSRGDYLVFWQRDAFRILSQNSSIQSLQWVDSSGIVRQMVPEENKHPGTDQIVHLYPDRRTDWQLNVKSNKTKISSFTRADTINHFIFDIPAMYNGKFQGSITAQLDFESYFAKMGLYLKQYAIEVKDASGHVLYSLNNPQPKALSKNLIFSQKISFDEDHSSFWIFDLMPNDADALDKSTFLSDMGFIFGLAMSFMLGMILFYYLKALEAIKSAKKSNQQLITTNAALEQEREKANQASKAKTEFVSNMSHEIRTPLNAILGLAELLKDKGSTEEGRHYLELMQQSSKALLALINDVLIIDKIESGKEKLAQDQFSPKEVMKNMIEFYRPAIENKGLSLDYNRTSLKKIVAIGDRARFEQILINLISNAIKFTPRGSLTITYKEILNHEGRLSLLCSVSDTGIGIPKDKIAIIFDRFTQLDSGMRKKHPGGGLGLSVTKQQIKLMNGTLKVESEEHVGSVFTFGLEFPIFKATSNPEVSRDKNPVSFSKLNVLAVDDNKLNNIILSKVLNIMKINTDLAYNGREALERVMIKNFDLILMDVHMPEMDGFETTRKIRETNKKVLIIGLSADATQNAIDEGYRAGMDHYLTKPLDREKLKTVLSMHFGVERAN